MEIIDNRGLLLRVQHPEKITAAIPHSHYLGNNQVLVKWGIDEARVLKNLDIQNVPSPILGRYRWTGKYAPMDHQRTTSSFLTMHRRAFCFNEQGTGKTASAIWAADYLMKVGIVKRVLVVCPLSIMDSAWRADLFTFAMHRKVDIAYGEATKRKKIIASDAEFIIINYDGVAVVRAEIASGGFDLIIIDEATHYKNTSTDRWKTMNKLITPNMWLWLMTGTPAAQSPIDAYGLAKLVNPKSVPRTKGSFQDQVMFRVTQFKWVPKATANTTVFNALQPAIRFTKKECLDLPEMTYVKRKVELTKQQKKYYDLVKQKMRAIADDGESITAANAAINMNKLLQISCGAVYSDSGETLEMDIRNRYAVLQEVIDESSQKVLVFAPFKHIIAYLVESLTRDGVATAAITGEVPANQRTRIFEQFQKEENPRVLVIQPQAAAHGVTLTAANTVIWWGPTPSVEIYTQANARVHRQGQRHPCTVVGLQGSPVEEYVYAMLDGKLSLHTTLIDLYKQILE